jgi:hypothetical protein
MVGTAQEHPSPFEFKLVDSTSVLTQAQLYSKAREWVAINFKSAKDVVQLEDATSGKIIAKGLMTSPSYGTLGLTNAVHYIKFTTTIDVRPGRYRIVLSDFSNDDASNYQVRTGGSLDKPKPSAWVTKRTWEEMKSNCARDSKALLASFQDHMDKVEKDKDGF